MKTRFVEVTQDIAAGSNWGKMLVGTFDREEWMRRQQLPGAADTGMLLSRGWTPGNVLVLDLQTGEGAIFRPGGSAQADLTKHRVWVCPMFEPFLVWLYEFIGAHEVGELAGHLWFDALPAVVELPDAEFSFAGYRRPGPSA